MCKPISIYIFCLLVTGKITAQSSNTGANSYDEGVKLKNAEKYSEALMAFENAIEKKPDYTDALYEAGWLSNELKEYNNAITYLKKAKQLKPSATIFFELAYAYDHSGKKDEAKDNYRKALELYPKYYDADKYLGDIFYDEENYETALSYYKKYFDAAKAPDNYYYYKAAWCSNDLKDYANALLYLEKYQPYGQKDFAEKYAEIGHTYFMLGYIDDAITAYQTAVDANPNYGIALRGLADVYYNSLQDYNKALEYFNLAFQKDEENSKECYRKAGRIYIAQARDSEAIIVLQKAIEYDPKDFTSREQLGYAYFMQNKYSDAIGQFDKVIELDAQSRLSYYYKGLCYVSLNQTENAREVYSQLKSINKGDAETLLKEIKQKEKILKSLASNKNSKKKVDQ